MKNNYLAKQKRQFKGLCKKISKNWDNFSNQERENLLARFRRLYGKLKSAFARPALRKMMGAAALVLMSMGGVQAQQFAAPVADTFGLTSDVERISSPYFVDIDGDGDMDMFSGSDIVSSSTALPYFYYYENVGTATNPSFAAPALDTFGLTSLGYNTVPLLIDIDGDGDMDMLAGEGFGYGYFLFYENTGTPTAPSFANVVIDTFGLTKTHPYSYQIQPTAGDLDNDGDLDLLVGSEYGAYYYYENTGTPTAPSFAAPVLDTFGMTSTAVLLRPRFIDLDNDGDLDVVAGALDGTFEYLENIGTASSPSFAAAIRDTFGLVDMGNGAAPAFVDIDNDGDMDLMSGERDPFDGTAGFYFFENLDTTIISSTAFVEETLGVNIYPNPVSNELKVELPISANYQIRITDLTGREVYNEFVQGDKNLQLSTKTWPAGLYLLQVRDEQGNVETKKIVKQ